MPTIKHTLLGILCALPLCAADLSSCKATFNGTELTIANSHVARKWKVANGLLYATSLRDLDSGVEWLARPSAQPAPYPAAALADEKREVTFSQKSGKLGPVEAESLIAELTTTGATKLTYRFQGRDFRLTDVHGELVKPLLA